MKIDDYIGLIALFMHKIIETIQWLTKKKEIKSRRLKHTVTEEVITKTTTTRTEEIKYDDETNSSHIP